MNTKNSAKLFVRLVSLLLALLLTLSGCVGVGDPKETSGEKETVSEHNGTSDGVETSGGADRFITTTVEETRISENSNTFVTRSGIGVEVPGYLLTEEAVLTVTELQTVSNDAEGYAVTPVDVKLGDQSSFLGYLTIRIPYDEALLPQGASAAGHIVGMYYNPETTEWERVLSALDTEKKELIIKTDHLSTYGCFYIRDEGSRYAKVIGYDTTILYDIEPMEALNALEEYNTTKKLTGLAKMGANLMKGADGASDYVGYLSNVDAIIRMGDSAAGHPIHQKVFESLGNIGLVLNIYKVMSCLVNRDGTFERDVAGVKASVDTACALYAKHLGDVATYTESSAASSVAAASFAVACAAIFVFDKLIDYMFSEAKTMKYEKDEEIFAYFNDSYNGSGYTARTDNDWIRILFEISEQANGDDDLFLNMLNSNVYKYASRFWDVFDGKPEVLNDILIDTGYTRMSEASPAERDALFEKYKSNLYKRLETLQPAVQTYYEKKMEENVLASMQNAGKVLNSTLRITVSTDEKSLMDKKAAFADIAEGAVDKDWNPSLNGKSTKTLSSTVLAYLVVGSPKTVKVYDGNGQVVGIGELKQSGKSVYNYAVELIPYEEPATVTAQCYSMYELSHNGEKDKYGPDSFDEIIEYMLIEYGPIVMPIGKYDKCSVDINLSGTEYDSLTADVFVMKGDFYRGDEGAGCTLSLHMATDPARVDKERGYIVHDYTFDGECAKCYQYPNRENTYALIFIGTYRETTRMFDEHGNDITPEDDFSHKNEEINKYSVTFVLVFEQP